MTNRISDKVTDTAMKYKIEMDFAALSKVWEECHPLAKERFLHEYKLEPANPDFK